MASTIDEECDDFFQPNVEEFDHGLTLAIDDFAPSRRRPNRRCSVTEHVLRAQQCCLKQIKEQNDLSSRDVFSCPENTKSQSVNPEDDEEGNGLVTHVDSSESQQNPVCEPVEPISSDDKSGFKEKTFQNYNSIQEMGITETESLPSSKRVLLRLWPRRATTPEKLSKAPYQGILTKPSIRSSATHAA